MTARHDNHELRAGSSFSDCSTWAQSVGLGPVLWCFGMILCWSRWRIWWFTTSVDREHTFEGVARSFDAAGGVPQICRADRTGALGQSQPRRFQLGPEALEFARHHGTEIKACQAGDAKRKGKVERPFRDLKESFLADYFTAPDKSAADPAKWSANAGLAIRSNRAEFDTSLSNGPRSASVGRGSGATATAAEPQDDEEDAAMALNGRHRSSHRPTTGDPPAPPLQSPK